MLPNPCSEADPFSRTEHLILINQVSNRRLDGVGPAALKAEQLDALNAMEEQAGDLEDCAGSKGDRAIHVWLYAL